MMATELLRAPLSLTVWAVEMVTLPASAALAAFDVVGSIEARAAEIAIERGRRFAECQNDTLFAIRCSIDDLVTRLARAADAARARLAA
jgi:transcription termination factor Rho